MGKLFLYTRSFHPDTNFGMGGLFFEGDGRGFSLNPGVTARVWHILEIDLEAGKLGPARCDSDPSSNAVPEVINAGTGLVDDAAEVVANSVLDPQVIVDNPPPANANRVPNIPKLPPMANDYSQPRKKPRHNFSGSVTPYREDGDQSINCRIQYAGKNFAFYGADTDVGHWLLGGNVSDGGSNTDGGHLKVWERWGGVVPDLDVTHEFHIRIARNFESGHITSEITGDGFPNCESFLIDSSSNPLALATHIRIGTAMTQLPGGRALPMSSTMIVSDIQPGDLFGSNTFVQLANDFTGDGSPQEVAKYGNLSTASWNNTHTGRDASGDWIRQLEDNIPIPRQSYGKFLDWWQENF